MPKGSGKVCLRRCQRIRAAAPPRDPTGPVIAHPLQEQRLRGQGDIDHVRKVRVGPRTHLRLSELRLSPCGMRQASNTAGHSRRGSSPSRTRAYLHVDSSWSNLPGALRGRLSADLKSTPRSHARIALDGAPAPNAESARPNSVRAVRRVHTDQSAMRALAPPSPCAAAQVTGTTLGWSSR